MTKTMFSEVVQSQDDSVAPGGRGEYYLKRPNEFFDCGCRSVDKQDERTDNTIKTEMSHLQEEDIHNAAAMLSHLLPRQTQKPQTMNPNISTVTRPASLPYKDQDCQEFVPIINHIDHEVLLTNQPYRTTPLVLPHAKTIHNIAETQNKLMSTTMEPQAAQPYRNSTLVMAAPRTINEAGIGAGPYRPYRGPQYYADRKPGDKSLSVYNSPVQLCSKDTLAMEADNPAIGQVTHTQPPPHREPSLTRGQESATHQMVLESELSQEHSTRPDSQLSNTLDRWRPATDPVMKNSSINQSASFKKLMYSVMGDSEF